MKTNAFSAIIFLSATAMAFATTRDSTYWLHDQGSGWGTSQDLACWQAKSDVDRALDEDCRFHAQSNRYWLHSTLYDPCSCFSSGTDTFRCTNYANATCTVFER